MKRYPEVLKHYYTQLALIFACIHKCSGSNFDCDPLSGFVGDEAVVSQVGSLTERQQGQKEWKQLGRLEQGGLGWLMKYKHVNDSSKLPLTSKTYSSSVPKGSELPT